MKRLLKITLLATSVLLLVLIALAGFTQTQMFRDWLRGELIKRVEKNLNGQLFLGRLKGNLITRFELERLGLIYQNDSLITVHRIDFDLAPLELLRRRVVIKDLVIDRPAVLLRQESDETWNFMSVLRLDSTKSAGKPWTIELPAIAVNKGRFSLKPLESGSLLSHHSIDSLSFRLGLSYDREEIRSNLRSLEASLAEFPLTFRINGGEIDYAPDTLSIKDLSIDVGRSRIECAATIHSMQSPEFDIALQLPRIDLEELKQFYPKLRASGLMTAALTVKGNRDAFHGKARFDHDASKLSSSFSIKTVENNYAYHLFLDMTKLELRDWLPDQEIGAVLNGSAELNGRGISFEEMAADFKLRLKSSILANQPVRDLALTGSVKHNRLTATLKAASRFGRVDLWTSAGGLKNEPSYSLKMEAENLNLASLLSDPSLNSDLSFELQGDGQSLDWEKLEFNGNIRMRPSSIYEIQIDTLWSQFRYHDGVALCDTILIRSDAGSIYAAGLLSLAYRSHLKFDAELGDLELLKHSLEADTLFASGRINGHLSGPADSLTIGGAYNLQQVQYNLVKIEQAAGDFRFLRSDTVLTGTLESFGDRIRIWRLPVDSAHVRVDYRNGESMVAGELWQGSENHAKIFGRHSLADTTRFVVENAEIALFGREWQAANDSMVILSGEDEYFFHDVSLISGRQRVFLEGKLSYVAAGDLAFGIEDLEVASFETVAGREGTLRGYLDLEGRLFGTASQPQVAGHFLLRNGKISEFAFDYWAGEIKYENELATWDFTLAQDSVRKLTGEGYFPFRFTLDDSATVIYDDRPIRIQAATTGLDLSFLQAFTKRLRQVSGILVFDIKLENTLSQIEPHGVVRIFNGTLSVPRFQTRYKDIRLVMTVDPGLVNLTFLEALGDKGKLQAKGQLFLKKGQLEKVEDVEFMADNFRLANTRDMNLSVTGSLRANGNAERLAYSGQLTVNRSQFFVDQYQSQSMILQLAASEKDSLSKEEDESEIALDTAEELWFKNITGDVKVKISRNTRVTGSDFNLEIEGDLQFIQEDDDYSIFGNIDIIRGSYEILGKRLDVQTGRIKLQGDVQTSPKIDLTARYIFRQRGQESAGRRRLYVRITDDLYNPTISFYLDDLDTKIEERDAVSYLLFNAPSEDVGFQLSQEAGNAANLLVGGLISDQLAKSLGKTLKLDVIDFYGGQELAESTVLVGKYFTSDLFDIFVSYTQDFSSLESSDGSKVALELELNRPVWFPFVDKRVFLPVLIQAAKGGRNDKETGFDLIWKLEW